MKIIMSEEKFGRSQSWANLEILTFTWTETEAIKDLVRIAGNLVKIQTKFFHNIHQQHYSSMCYSCNLYMVIHDIISPL
jgi:hypothetical protein